MHWEQIIDVFVMDERVASSVILIVCSKKSGKSEVLLQEHEQLKAQLAASQVQHEAVAAQFNETLTEEERQEASLFHQQIFQLQPIVNSRQERGDPDQLLLFSPDELQDLVEQMGHARRPEEEGTDESPENPHRMSRGGGCLPQHIQARSFAQNPSSKNDFALAAVKRGE